MKAIIRQACVAGLVLALQEASETTLPQSTALAPGLRVVDLPFTSESFANERLLRVRLPEGYDAPEHAERRYPLLLVTDGIAAFDARGWGLPSEVARLEREGAIEPWIVVGIDNGGSTLHPTSKAPVLDRASEFLRVPDPSWTEDPRPEPRGDRFDAFLADEVLPFLEARFRIRAGAPSRALAGASYGALAVLRAGLSHPKVFGRLYLQSPSLHVEEEALLARVAAAAPWTTRVFLACGTAEGETPAIQDAMVTSVERLASALEARSSAGLVRQEIVESGIHAWPAFRASTRNGLAFLLADPAAPSEHR